MKFTTIKSLFRINQPPLTALPKPEAQIEILESDAYDRAYHWAWQQEGMKNLVRLCYKTPDFADNARRFSESQEFFQTLYLIRSYGQFQSERP